MNTLPSMVVGNGMIARRFSAFDDRDDILIFASGVSNSKENRASAFAREKKLVEESIASSENRLFVYFSTCSVTDPTEQGSPYVTHKLFLEAYIAGNCKNYLIVRASNVVGKTDNPHTVLNFFVNRIRNHEPFDVWQGATRNLIDVDDVYRIVTAYIGRGPGEWNQTINVANPYSVKPLDIVQAIEKQLGLKALYRLIDKGEPFEIDTTQSAAVLQDQRADLQPERYLKHLLQKYYA
ncbi:NAD-dependent epimerase/dehydratase family protein [Larkinella sp.]|uniref:NAD-dependent epimerase/dehydratase family protein n=1 Tax=Larkinella sp. TaxID=2034517 RepID=UPI003BAC4283